jgi:hypothetical protein
MYSLNLKEVEIDPRISEDKMFQNKDEIDLEDEVLRYITGTYPEVYKNPMTLGRKIREAIRDDSGKNMNERVGARGDAFDREVKEKVEKAQAVQAQSDQEFEPKRAEFDQWRIKQTDRINEELKPKIDAAKNPEEKKALEEERMTKLEDLTYEYEQKLATLTQEQSARTKELRDQA